MADITHLPVQRTGLTSGHRFLMYAIQDLCIDISQQTEHKAMCQYMGHVHTLAVDIVPPEHLAEDKGGNGSFSRCWFAEVRLPPNTLAGPDSLQELGDIIAGGLPA